jgi:hypothetical protein
MKYALSGTVAPALNHNFPFILLHSLHFHTTIYPSLTNFTPLYFTSCTNFTSLHYIFYGLHHTFTSPDVSLPIIFHKIAWFTGESLQSICR